MNRWLLALVVLMNLAQDVPVNGGSPEPERLFHVACGYWHNHRRDWVDLWQEENFFVTYDEAHTYVTAVSRRHPNATCGLDRIVSYTDAAPGVVHLGVPLGEGRG